MNFVAFSYGTPSGGGVDVFQINFNIELAHDVVEHASLAGLVGSKVHLSIDIDGFICTQLVTPTGATNLYYKIDPLTLEMLSVGNDTIPALALGT